MASIIKKRKLYYVVYYYADNDGHKLQKWESYRTQSEAKKRKTEVEYEQQNGVFVLPTVKTVRELLVEFVEQYSSDHWSYRTYVARKSIINHYILPYIGDLKLSEVKPKTMDYYFQRLKTVKMAAGNNHKNDGRLMSTRNIREVYKVLNPAFQLAVKWEYMAKNPVTAVTLPQYTKTSREIWTAEELFYAIQLCENENLAVCIHLAFACSMRIGEILGLTWDCVDISDISIENGNTNVYIDKTLERVSNEAIEKLGTKEIFRIIPSVMSIGNSSLVLKKPKTQSSVRRVWIPKTVALMLKELQLDQQEKKIIFGHEYQDLGLVISQTNGRPVEARLIEKEFKKLIDSKGLPPVQFHSLRHTSTTYKLKMTGGDLKLVQGDTGHAQAKMVTDTYAHILDGERRQNASKLEDQFYQSSLYHKKERLLPEPAPEIAENNIGVSPEDIINALQQSPDLFEKLLKSLNNNTKNPISEN